MDVMLAEQPAGNDYEMGDPHGGIVVLDPLDDDAPTDRVVVTTERAISRIALVAAETGARFQRDAVPYDAMAWMLSPRKAFDGAAPIEACLGRDACMRGVLMHGLGLGLDIDRPAIDALMAHDDDDGFDDAESDHLYGAASAPNTPGRLSRSRTGRATRLRLYTATLADTRDNVMIQAFHASMARNAEEVRARLVGRFGPDMADAADIRPGIHRASPIVMALVPDAVVEMIQCMQGDPRSPAARTFGVDIQQCIQA